MRELKTHCVISEVTESVERIGFTLAGLAEIDICKVEAKRSLHVRIKNINVFIWQLYQKHTLLDLEIKIKY